MLTDLILVVGVILGALGAFAWLYGFWRAAKRAPLEQRLRDYAARR